MYRHPHADEEDASHSEDEDSTHIHSFSVSPSHSRQDLSVEIQPLIGSGTTTATAASASSTAAPQTSLWSRQEYHTHSHGCPSVHYTQLRRDEQHRSSPSSLWLSVVNRPRMYVAFLMTVLMTALLATLLISALLPKLQHDTLLNRQQHIGDKTHKYPVTRHALAGDTKNTTETQLKSASQSSFLSISGLPTLSSAHRTACEHRYPGSQLYPHLNAAAVPDNQSYYIAVNLHNNAAIMVDFITELTRLVTVLCTPSSPVHLHLCPNVFVSVYESDSGDQTPAVLDLFAFYLSALHVPHTVVSSGSVHKDHHAYRIDHLAAVRNAAMLPFYQQPTTNSHSNSSTSPYDRIVFLNDVLFCAEDVLRLLSHSRNNVSMVCGLDYDDPHRQHTALFYDTWVMRSITGAQVSKVWPYFSDDYSRTIIQQAQPFNVFCCWNGLVVLSAKEWYEYHLTFRAHDVSEDERHRCEASECSHVCESYWAIHQQHTHILVDPMVHVAYDYKVYSQIEQQPWFIQQAEQRQRIWDATSEDALQQREVLNVTHNTLKEWECCDLHFKCKKHRIEQWSEAEKYRRRHSNFSGF